MTLAFALAWVLGHVLAYVLLGIALARARAIPLWAACLLIVSAPLMGPIAYGTNLGLLQILGYVLVFIGSIPAALAMLKRRDEQAWEPQSEEPAPTS
jgi:hydrogenase/urease accessory protein HupE